MKAILNFDMNDEDDKSEFDTMYNAQKYKNILWNLDNHLRDIIKYNGNNLSSTKIKIYQEIRDYLTNLCLEENVDLY